MSLEITESWSTSRMTRSPATATWCSPRSRRTSTTSFMLTDTEIGLLVSSKNYFNHGFTIQNTEQIQFFLPRFWSWEGEGLTEEWPRGGPAPGVSLHGQHRGMSSLLHFEHEMFRLSAGRAGTLRPRAGLQTPPSPSSNTNFMQEPDQYPTFLSIMYSNSSRHVFYVSRLSYYLIENSSYLQ